MRSQRCSNLQAQPGTAEEFLRALFMFKAEAVQATPVFIDKEIPFSCHTESHQEMATTKQGHIRWTMILSVSSKALVC